MASALINENPVVHEKKERVSKPQANYNDSAPDVIDELEIFDILSVWNFRPLLLEFSLQGSA